MINTYMNELLIENLNIELLQIVPAYNHLCSKSKTISKLEKVTPNIQKLKNRIVKAKYI